MSKSIKIALFTMGLFVGLAGASFFGSKHFPEQKTQTPTMSYLQPVKDVPLDLSKAKTTKDLPPGILPAQNDEQFPIAQTPSGSVVFLDVSSIRLVDNKASFLVSIVEPEGTISDAGDHILGVVLKQVVDCKLHKGTTEYSIVVSEDGRILSAKTNIPGTHDITPGSKGAQVEKMICTPPDGTPYKVPKKISPGSQSV